MTKDELLKKICPLGTCDCGDDYESCNCDDCNRVLEEWLCDYEKHVIEQYKADTNLKDTIREIHDNVAREMYCKGIDDFAENISLEISESIIWDMIATMNKNSSLSDTSDKIVDYVINTANEIAEQLKAGETE